MAESGSRATGDVLTQRLGYLLKHVQARLAEESARALEPFGVSGRELAVLAVLGEDRPISQLEGAGKLGVDRTTMVALVDRLERDGLVERRRSELDRRKNVVALTERGEDLLRRAEDARRRMEREFLAPLGGAEAEWFLRALRLLLADDSR
ncbi:MarR family winged helix-turn-helix transcriptional regulator [Actinomadura rupiterrae]|uniref:MarR family winged helix-turn-helix transcriptional regulator n=1 Tax=Actinomadura rupiterrae TaxID=559627 RepID=UPI0020A5144A|nr:MarR family transcriptional regulator [Actinomadura rupiterrae]MCP2338839.1 DNA-binding MarR family transcriptional regulator [Actinomadura rupiterrae]